MERVLDAGGGPRIVSWNVTARCNLACAHCYIDADGEGSPGELDTAEGMALIDQIAAVGRPILVLSGGEPLLRPDIFDLARYAAGRGLRVAMGTNGILVTDAVAERLSDTGIRKVAVSIDSTDPGVHDAFRGVSGAWEKAVNGIRALRRAGVPVQIHTTIGEPDIGEIDRIIAFGKSHGVRDYQFFFPVPTGRGEDLADLPPEVHEAVIGRILAHAREPGFSVRPTCAPQFVRVAARMGLDLSQWGRGCIAGTAYCRITPVGDVTPCPYLPVPVGNIRREAFSDIWHGSEIFAALRDPDSLGGKCGQCEYRRACGGCRARAYGVRHRRGDACGGPVRPGDPDGDILAEDPCCPYEPGEITHD
ncbi:MAG TPA: radical SAM protein [Methanoculleus sp.]|jgi:radical SAM protein with 4Fe4S-binding SPASM domain|uniref:radical SAM/SPASM domain-containing protein n=1 Tax=Methanoculleus sp. TaxID=90427 RepID=UPI000AA641E9|nr:radical SAM protein [Methanoculleus sp.]MBP7143700.1 radical SAM protein [Methanoculleus sp.]HOF96766.1 radical SAM protein [Methanoculleus sp.]HQL59087.1 radical SAM protein [Methanoculleus sp.]